MSLNYLRSAYLRVRRADGAITYIAPAEIAAQGEARPVAFATGLPVLDTFAVELLIGLFQYALAPESEDALLHMLDSPPDVAALRDMLAAKADGFDLFGDTPAFQDPSVAGEKPSPIGRLLPTAAGEQTRKRNQDILNREIAAMRPEIAMLALAFVQAHSPAGGRGTRTSASGGGPLRTVVERDTPLATVLANLLPQERFRDCGTPGGDGLDPLPWRSAIRGKRTQENTPPEHVYFACPRRILLGAPEPATPERGCDVSGERDVALITAMRQKAEGPDYESTGWRHPLTPYVYRKQKDTVKAFPMLAATLTLGAAWRERWGLFGDVGTPGVEGPVAAKAVRRWRDERAHDLEAPRVRVRAFGLRCDNAKVESVVDLPFTFRAFPSQSTDAVAQFESHLSEIVAVGEAMARALRQALAAARFGAEGANDAPRDWGREHQVAFWQRTDAAFQFYVDTLARALEGVSSVHEALESAARQQARAKLQRHLRDSALDIFDEICAPELTGEAALAIAVARRKLEAATAKAARTGIDPEVIGKTAA